MKAFLSLLFIVTLVLEVKAEDVVSPNSPWPENIFEQQPEEEHSLGYKILLWVPNRVLDFIDIFKFDVGAGPAVGGVIRISRYAQAGFRTVAPLSVRVGLMGRRLPFMVETSSEIGVSPAFKQSHDRDVCAAEIGLGVDLFLGVYGGVCLDETFDFISGLFLVDLQGDDF